VKLLRLREKAVIEYVAVDLHSRLCIELGDTLVATKSHVLFTLNFV